MVIAVNYRLGKVVLISYFNNNDNNYHNYSYNKC